jgi:hypothetical protein
LTARLTIVAVERSRRRDIRLTGYAGSGMKCAHIRLLSLMLSLGSFFLIFCALIASVWWACAEDKNQT